LRVAVDRARVMASVRSLRPADEVRVIDPARGDRPVSLAHATHTPWFHLRASTRTIPDVEHAGSMDTGLLQQPSQRRSPHDVCVSGESTQHARDGDARMADFQL